MEDGQSLSHGEVPIHKKGSGIDVSRPANPKVSVGDQGAGTVLVEIAGGEDIAVKDRGAAGAHREIPAGNCQIIKNLKRTAGVKNQRVDNIVLTGSSCGDSAAHDKVRKGWDIHGITVLKNSTGRDGPKKGEIQEVESGIQIECSVHKNQRVNPKSSEIRLKECGGIKIYQPIGSTMGGIIKNKSSATSSVAEIVINIKERTAIQVINNLPAIPSKGTQESEPSMIRSPKVRS